MEIDIRPARLGDEGILAAIQTESWKAAFGPFLEEETLAKATDLDKATAMYRRVLEAHKGQGLILSLEGEPHGIAWWDAARDKDKPGAAELICIHSRPGNWGKGFGRQLMARLLQDMAAAGYKEVCLWVFEPNLRARRFYEAAGFRPDGKTQPGYGAQELRYCRGI